MNMLEFILNIGRVAAGVLAAKPSLAQLVQNNDLTLEELGSWLANAAGNEYRTVASEYHPIRDLQEKETKVYESIRNAKITFRTGKEGIVPETEPFSVVVESEQAKEVSKKVVVYNDFQFPLTFTFSADLSSDSLEIHLKTKNKDKNRLPSEYIRIISLLDSGKPHYFSARLGDRSISQQIQQREVIENVVINIYWFALANFEKNLRHYSARR